MDFMTGLKRTDYCGVLTMKDVGREVTVAGWVQRQRDLGALIFVDLRDRTGIVQLAFDEGCDKEVFDKAFTVRSEYVLMARGTVRERSAKNKDIATGDIEIDVKEQILKLLLSKYRSSVCDEKKLKRTIASLQRYGYSWEDIQSALKELKDNFDNDL